MAPSHLVLRHILPMHHYDDSGCSYDCDYWYDSYVMVENGCWVANVHFGNRYFDCAGTASGHCCVGTVNEPCYRVGTQ